MKSLILKVWKNQMQMELNIMLYLFSMFTFSFKSPVGVWFSINIPFDFVMSLGETELLVNTGSLVGKS